MKNKKKEILWMLVALVSLAVITLGVSVALFNYTKEGTTENTVTSGTITFLYTEVSGVGKGIQISDAYPMTDEQGKKQTGQGSYFDFKITSQTTSNISIPYEVTARKSNDSTLENDAIKVYLTEKVGEEEKLVLLENYSKLEDTSQVTAKGYTEKVIYTDKVPANQSNYEKNFRLRMWIDETTDFSGKEEETGNVTYPYNGKTFTLTVNVYSNGKVVTNKEGVMEGDSILSILSDNEFEDGYYQFEVKEETYLVHMYVYDGNQHWTSEDETIFGDAQDVATATENAKNMVIVKVKGDLTIEEDTVVGPYFTDYGGPKGFLLYVEGTLTNKGTIDNSHGAKAEGQNVYLWRNSNGSYETVPAVGGKGHAGVTTTSTFGAYPGESGKGRQTGGGGSAGGWNGTTGNGGDGTSYSGGTGSGGGDKGNGQAGSPNGGAGGNALGSGGGAGGGAGNPGGSSIGNASKGSNGTGGLLVVYANTLINQGKITAEGAAGGIGNNLGGYSGGGSINLFYTGEYQNKGMISAVAKSYNNVMVGGCGTTTVGVIQTGDFIEIEKSYIYTGTEETFVTPVSGNYRLETWGAQGGNASSSYLGGYGAYASGTIHLSKNEILYINVGGQGQNTTTSSNQIAMGGYNGGGNAYNFSSSGRIAASGGGATHIAKKTGILSSLENNIDQILIVSAGGGGTWYYSSAYHTVNIGHAGGYIGNGSSYIRSSASGTCNGGTQNGPGPDVDGGILASFGQGASSSTSYSSGSSGGGGGFYGGNVNIYASGGGSSYIGNVLLSNKVMYCYSCAESEDEATKTISTTNVSKDPISYYAKEGDGYAKITYLGE